MSLILAMPFHTACFLLTHKVVLASVLFQLKSDYDRGEFSIKYILSGEGAGDVFEIDEYSGEIRTLQKLDREEKAYYVLQAQAINRRSNEPVEPQSEFIIKVQDINDNVPQFQNEPYVSSIPEMCPTGTSEKRLKKFDLEMKIWQHSMNLIASADWSPSTSRYDWICFRI